MSVGGAAGPLFVVVSWRNRTSRNRLFEADSYSFCLLDAAECQQRLSFAAGAGCPSTTAAASATAATGGTSPVTPECEQQPFRSVAFPLRCQAVSPFAAAAAASAPNQAHPEAPTAPTDHDVLAWLEGWGRLAAAQDCAAPPKPSWGIASLFASDPSSR